MRDYTVTIDSYHRLENVCLCVQLDNVPVLQGHTVD